MSCPARGASPSRERWRPAPSERPRAGTVLAGTAHRRRPRRGRAGPEDVGRSPLWLPRADVHMRVDPEVLHTVEARRGDLALHRLRSRMLTEAVDDCDLVVVAVEADRRVGYVVDHDRIYPLATKLRARTLERTGAVLGREPDDRLPRAADRGSFAQDVGGRHELEREAAALLLCDLARLG